MTKTTNRTIIVHGHIFKNAGTSFDWALQRNFSEHFIDHEDGREMMKKAYLAKFIEANPGLQALATHHLYRWMPLPELPGVTTIPCFLLRHPIERVRSVYDFERRQESDTPGAVYAKKLNFKDYIAWRLDHKAGGVVMNYQTKYCSGRTGKPIDGPLLESTVEYMQSSSLTGVVDRFDESMVYFEEALRSTFPQIDLAYVRQNMSAGKASNVAVEKKASAVLDELGSVGPILEGHNQADLLLYVKANEALDKVVGEIEGFETKLKKFRKRCKKLHKILQFR